MNQLHFLVIGMFFLVLCCKHNEPNAFEKGIDRSRLKSDGIAVVSWPCAGTGKEYPAGLNSQEEYCEWTREPESYKGKGFKSTGTAEQINLPKACIFTTSFDQTRKYFLTKRTVDTTRNPANPFNETRANSYAFLVGGNEPDSKLDRVGIIGHCINGNDCDFPKDNINCVPERASDPEICLALNQLSERKCKADTKFEIAPVITAGSVPPRRHGDRIVKPQLSIRSTISENCWFVEDPNIVGELKNQSGQGFNALEQGTLVACDAEALKVKNCDMLGGDLSVNATLKIVDQQCVGGAAPGPGLKVGVFCKTKIAAKALSGPNPSANPRFQIPPGHELFVRGFLSNFVSIVISLEGTEYGANVGTPTFVNRPDIDASSCFIR